MATIVTTIHHDDGSVEVRRDLMPGVSVGAISPVGDEFDARRKAYAAEVALRDVIRHHGLAYAVQQQGFGPKEV